MGLNVYVYVVYWTKNLDSSVFQVSSEVKALSVFLALKENIPNKYIDGYKNDKQTLRLRKTCYI